MGSPSSPRCSAQRRVLAAHVSPDRAGPGAARGGPRHRAESFDGLLWSRRWDGTGGDRPDRDGPRTARRDDQRRPVARAVDPCWSSCQASARWPCSSSAAALRQGAVTVPESLAWRSSSPSGVPGTGIAGPTELPQRGGWYRVRGADRDRDMRSGSSSVDSARAATLEFRSVASPTRAAIRSARRLLRVPAGRTVALVGGRPLGQSTIAPSPAGSRPERGSVRRRRDARDLTAEHLAGTGPSSYRCRSFRRHCPGPVALGRDGAPTRWYGRPAVAHADGFVARLRTASTRVGERGTSLSGGPRQRSPRPRSGRTARLRVSTTHMAVDRGWATILRVCASPDRVSVLVVASCGPPSPLRRGPSPQHAGCSPAGTHRSCWPPCPVRGPGPRVRAVRSRARTGRADESLSMSRRREATVGTTADGAELGAAQGTDLRRRGHGPSWQTIGAGWPSAELRVASPARSVSPLSPWGGGRALAISRGGHGLRARVAPVGVIIASSRPPRRLCLTTVCTYLMMRRVHR